MSFEECFLHQKFGKKIKKVAWECKATSTSYIVMILGFCVKKKPGVCTRKQKSSMIVQKATWSFFPGFYERKKIAWAGI